MCRRARRARWRGSGWSGGWSRGHGLAEGLDHATVRVLREQQRRQRAERAAAGDGWVETGHVFTRPDGTPVKPGYLSQRFRILVRHFDLPPVRLHDLRHGAASLAHTARADLKLIQGQLGHASIVLTADTYTSVLPAAYRKAAEATARLVLTAARGARARMSGRHQALLAYQAAPETSRTASPAAAPPNPAAAARPTASGRAKARRHRGRHRHA